MTLKKVQNPRRKREGRGVLLRLIAAATVCVAAGGAIVSIAASPIISTSVTRPSLSATSGLSLSVNPAFRQPQRAQSAKGERLLAASAGTGRALPMEPDEIRLSYLKPKLEKAGAQVLAVWQRGLVHKQIEENAAAEIALAGPPPALAEKPAKPAASPSIPAATALAAVAPGKDTTQDAGNAFELVLQGADSSRLADGEVPVPEQRPGGSKMLAYAAPGHDDYDQLFGEVPERTKKVAVYDISAGKVYMPDGEVMEAHSGIGKYRDNPKYTHVKMAGAVPAATYKLTPREALFHGVPALRMTSVDGTNPLGRTGLLAHTYMLRTPGDSHGCLVFKDYYKFLKAYRAGRVDYIVAVSSLGAGATLALANRTS
ncbi:DUF2778 domain-containing protein [Martelella endophytica]|uniref:DUF2778 domain-containing protein n=1 Tax=Martelella endophytica TaxID=1486262 RepID=UPI000AC483EF|nr:DUF2778 domain-containing protein [Martelella endophytica]